MNDVVQNLIDGLGRGSVYALLALGIALIFGAELGRAPWDVLHEGIGERLDVGVGAVIIASGVAIMVLWIPLRERPGIGTVLNALLIGLVFDQVLPHVPDTELLAPRLALLFGGILVVGVGSGIYIRAELGAGPRDGLMTGLERVTPMSIRVARTLIEVVVLATGFVLGGEIGFGTLAFALGIGPVVQVALRVTDSLLGATDPPSTPPNEPHPSPDTEAY